MKLDYKIIWVEDKIDTKPFLALRQTINEHLVKIDVQEKEQFKWVIENNFKLKDNKSGNSLETSFELVVETPKPAKFDK